MDNQNVVCIYTAKITTKKKEVLIHAKHDKHAMKYVRHKRTNIVWFLFYIQNRQMLRESRIKVTKCCVEGEMATLWHDEIVLEIVVVAAQFCEYK